MNDNFRGTTQEFPFLHGKTINFPRVGNADAGIREIAAFGSFWNSEFAKVFLVPGKSGIMGFGIRNSAVGIPNPAKTIGIWSPSSNE